MTIVETSNLLATGLPVWYTQSLIHWFSHKGVRTLTDVKYEQITDRGLTLVTKEGNKETIEADTIVVTMPPEPNTDLSKAIKGKVPEVYLTGAANGMESYLIVDAIADGSRIGRAI